MSESDFEATVRAEVKGAATSAEARERLLRRYPSLGDLAGVEERGSEYYGVLIHRDGNLAKGLVEILCHR